MATLTTQILIGKGHSNHDGINPSHYLFLSENSRPAWILLPENIFSQSNKKSQKITWIPTVDNMLEDAFLMIAIHIIKNQQIIDLGQSYSEKIESERLELYHDLNDSQRQELYTKCQEIANYPKLIISVFKDSTIQSQLSIINNYQMDVEVCCLKYSRLFSTWSNKIIIEGSL